VSAVIDEHVDRLRRLYHTPSADIIAIEVQQLEQRIAELEIAIAHKTEMRQVEQAERYDDAAR
jgi:cell division septum initiation protein DivIVA